MATTTAPVLLADCGHDAPGVRFCYEDRCQATACEECFAAADRCSKCRQKFCPDHVYRVDGATVCAACKAKIHTDTAQLGEEVIEIGRKLVAGRMSADSGAATLRERALDLEAIS